VKLIICLVFSLSAFAQGVSSVEPAPNQGRALFRSNCAFCHGLTAKGGRGPNLVSVPLNHGDTVEAMKNVIRRGVPGTTMPAFSTFDDDEVSQIVAFLRGLALGTPRQVNVPGNAQEGRAVYLANGCAGCHRIGDEGSIYGPELTRIGASRSLEYLRESIINPSADIPEEFEGVTVIQKDGARISGIRLNEDTFSVQLRDSAQRFRIFQKDQVRAVVSSSISLMPAFTSLAAGDLQNLLAYLASLRGPALASGEAPKAEGIK
jgi:cytochrome c oxidase cbb3-type subunit 3